jgi:glutathione S-transferase
MGELQLSGNRESGHSYKVRLMLHLAGLAHEYQEIDLALPRGARPEPFRSLAAFGEVPLLVHDGRPHVQSNAILLHLAAQTGAFCGESPEDLGRVHEWLFWEANRIGFSLPNLRYHLKFSGSEDAGVELMLRERFNADVARLDSELSDGRMFILGAMPTVADISLCGYLYWPEQARVTIPTQVQAWLERISTLPGWRHPYAFDA